MSGIRAAFKEALFCGGSAFFKGGRSIWISGKSHLPISIFSESMDTFARITCSHIYICIMNYTS
jgi:hypothetical protein